MTHRSHKPVRKCHGCPLNRGDHCWGYAVPRQKWRLKNGCPGCLEEKVHEVFRLWKKQAVIKTIRQIRRECLHHLPPEPIFYLEKENQRKLLDVRKALKIQ